MEIKMRYIPSRKTLHGGCYGSSDTIAISTKSKNHRSSTNVVVSIRIVLRNKDE